MGPRNYHRRRIFFEIWQYARSQTAPTIVEGARAAMHPSGVQFGLSRGLLQLKGEEVLLSDKLLEAISIEARCVCTWASQRSKEIFWWK